MPLLSVSENILVFICGFGILQGILLATFIYFHPRSDRSVNLFLALYILGSSAIISLPFVMNAVGWQNSFFIQPVPLLTGPLLYLYLRSFKEKITWAKALPHFVLFIACFGIAYWNLQRFGRWYPDAKQVPEEALHHPITIGMQYLKISQQLLYFFLSRKVLTSYRRSIQQLFSETSRINLNWASYLVNGFLVLVTVFMIIFPLMLRFPQHFFTLLLINMVVATPYIYGVAFKGMSQHAIWQVSPGMNKETLISEMEEVEKIPNAKNSTAEVSKPTYNINKTKELAERILQLIEQEKIYCETELTLQQLATKLQVPTYQVSLALNEGLKKNFYDLINGYRVEEAKRLLSDDNNNNYTILSIAFDAGFNSKTTFNTVFKKFTGLTPTAFRDSIKKNAVLS